MLQPFLISLKNILALAAFAASRLLKGPREARHCQGPSGIDAWVKRNRLSPKKISAFVAIGGRWRVPGRPDTVRDHQGSSFWSKETI